MSTDHLPRTPTNCVGTCETETGCTCLRLDMHRITIIDTSPIECVAQIPLWVRVVESVSFFFKWVAVGLLLGGALWVFGVM